LWLPKIGFCNIGNDTFRAVQNFEIVTMSFLGFGARAPLALLVGIVYLLGMAIGGSLWLLLRRSLHRSKLVKTQ
jgi:uncharacterized integral membrane protein